MAPVPLRHYGPRVFISYSFADRAVAETLHAALAARGFQVRREDDTSLFNQKLTEGVQRRIADAEVLIQLRTSASNRSAWVARELEMALARRDAGEAIVILPVVFDAATLPDQVKEWWFLDVEDAGLTETTIETMARMCQSVVHCLHLSDDDPFAIDVADLRTMLAAIATDGRRVIVDAGGCLLDWARQTVAFAEGADRPGFLIQERERLARLAERLKALDEVVRKLALEVMRAMGDGYTNDPVTLALRPLSRFFRIVLGDLVLAAARVAPPGHPLDDSTLRAHIEPVQRASTPTHSTGFMNPGLYVWAFDEGGDADGLARMGLDAPGFRTVPLQMPSRVFGSMAAVYASMPVPFDPRAELLASTYLNYVLPQIAADAYYNLNDVRTVRADLDARYAWTLEQYRTMGSV